MHINRVTLTGNLTRGPELRELASGSALCKMRLAVNTREKRDGEWRDRAHFFNVTTWGPRAKACAEHLSKGSPVAIDGRLEWREWQTSEGATRQDVSIVADQVQFLGGSRSSDDDASDADSEGWQSSDDDVPF